MKKTARVQDSIRAITFRIEPPLEEEVRPRDRALWARSVQHCASAANGVRGTKVPEGALKPREVCSPSPGARGLFPSPSREARRRTAPQPLVEL